MHCPLLTDPLDPLGPLGPTHIPTDHSDSDNFEIREKLGKMTTQILGNKKTEYMVSYEVAQAIQRIAQPKKIIKCCLRISSKIQQCLAVELTLSRLLLIGHSCSNSKLNIP